MSDIVERLRFYASDSVGPGARLLEDAAAEIARLRALLPAAWEAGRDAAAEVPGQIVDVFPWTAEAMRIGCRVAIAALRTPPDLAQQLKEPDA